MSITPRGMSVQEAYRIFRDGNLVVNRKYQRKLVWDLSEKRSLIDSILKDYPIPLILFARDSESQAYEIMDGMQRLHAIFAFIENHYDLEGQFFDTNEFSRAKIAAEAGVFTPADRSECQFLAASKVADFLDYQLAITVFPAVDENKTTDVFGRINSGGRQLSLQEKRQAGMVDEFSSLVRRLASEIRGDSSREILPLSDMPEISIDSTRTDMGYALKAEEIFWCRQGIMWTKQLRESEDEELISDICASIALGSPIARSKDLLDALYDPKSSDHEQLSRALLLYGNDRLYEEVKVTFSVIRETIEAYSDQPNALRSVVNPKSTNPIKTAFYSFFMAMHDLVIVEELTPDDPVKIVTALTRLQKDMVTTAKYSKTDDRIKNIDKTKGLIQRYFLKKDPPMLRHGAGLALDLENSLRRSRVETARYECKQGFLSLSNNRDWDTGLNQKILETICGVANVGPDADGFLFIGVADKKSDADRIELLDGVKAVNVGSRYVVGVNREFSYLQCSDEAYLERVLAFIRGSDLSERLKDQVLSHIDYVEYKGLSVIRICIPAQSEVSFVGNTAFVRENSSTIEAVGKKLVTLTQQFSQQGVAGNGARRRA